MASSLKSVFSLKYQHYQTFLYCNFLHLPHKNEKEKAVNKITDDTSPIEGVYIISVKPMTKHPPTHVATGWTGTYKQKLVHSIIGALYKIQAITDSESDSDWLHTALKEKQR